jgi:hypothetical protein
MFQFLFILVYYSLFWYNKWIINFMSEKLYKVLYIFILFLYRTMSCLILVYIAYNF